MMIENKRKKREREREREGGREGGRERESSTYLTQLSFSRYSNIQR
jgi:hypothetical protein